MNITILKPNSGFKRTERLFILVDCDSTESYHNNINDPYANSVAELLGH